MTPSNYEVFKKLFKKENDSLMMKEMKHLFKDMKNKKVVETSKAAELKKISSSHANLFKSAPSTPVKT